ncbi:MAG: FtsX-like permease family protein [Bacteroidota bacterium]
MLVSQQSRGSYERNMEQWNNFSTPTFIQLHDDVDESQLAFHLSKIVEKYMAENLEEDREYENVPDDIVMFEYQYSSLNDIHLHTQVQWTKVSDPKYSLILGGIALLILVIAAINYISLSLTTSASRKLEVGVRKSVGASRRQLVNQFSFESVLLAVISMLIGIALMYTFLPAFNEFTSKSISISSNVIVELLGLGLVLAVVVGLLAGSYPAFFLSNFKPAMVLKGGFTSKLKAGFTKPLVILQFALSAFLIISSLIMYRQMEYVTTKDLGYNQEQIIVVPTQLGWNEESNRLVERMRTRLDQEPFVVGVAGTSLSFSQGWSRYGYKIDGENKVAYVYAVDPYYLDVLDIELTEGRNFDLGIASDSNALVVNEALAKDMGWESPLQEHLNYREDTIGAGEKIIGVAKNYNFRSLEHAVEPLLLSINSNDVGYLTKMLIKIKPGDISQSIDKIQAIWTELLPDKPFDYTFLDQDVAKQYRSYDRWMSIMGLSTLFAILISCLGLFGLAGVNALNRTKEIGIRKVFGAELMNIFVLLNRQYVYLATIAFAIAIPISWYTMTQWLEDFEYGVSLSWEVFVLSMAAGLLIALLTVSYHALRTARLNPADTLKYE